MCLFVLKLAARNDDVRYSREWRDLDDFVFWSFQHNLNLLVRNLKKKPLALTRNSTDFCKINARVLIVSIRLEFYDFRGWDSVAQVAQNVNPVLMCIIKSLSWLFRTTFYKVIRLAETFIPNITNEISISLLCDVTKCAVS